MNAQGVGYRTLSISSIRNGRVEIAGNTKHAQLAPDTFERFRLVDGDVLVVRGNGNRALVGLCGIASDVPPDVFYPDLLIRLRFNESILLRDLAVAQWNSRLVHSELLKRAKSTNGIWKVNGKDVASHALLVPPSGEQVRLLEELQTLSAAVGASRLKLRALGLVARRLSGALLSDGCSLV